MTCPSCGGEWWVEEWVIRPANPPTDPHHAPPVRERRYRLRCTDCGHLSGAAPEGTWHALVQRTKTAARKVAPTNTKE